MKKLLTIAIVLASANAFATRARMAALGNAAVLTDTANMANPAKAMDHADSVTIETGVSSTSGTATTDNAEGLLIKSLGDAKLTFALGHKDAMVTETRQWFNGVVSSTAFSVGLNQQNPFEIGYAAKMGEMSYGAALVYSNYNDKLNKVKESSMGLRAGAKTAMWDADLSLGLSSKLQNDTTEEEIKGGTNVVVNAGYNVMPDLYVYGNVTMLGGKYTSATTTVSNIEQSAYTVGVISTMAKEGNTFLYGASLVSSTKKDKEGTEQKETEFTMPVMMGFETEAASWLVLRASIQQNVLLNDSKVSTTTGTTSETAPGANSTTVNAGAGLKLGKVLVDGTLTGLHQGGQSLNAVDLLGQVGMTYTF